MRRLKAIIPALLLLLAACAGIGDLRPGPSGPPSGGVTMLYPQKPQAVFAAVFQALPPLGLRVVEANPSQLYVLAERGINPVSNGENVGVYLTPEGDGTRVTVVSRRKVVTNITAKDFSRPVHGQLGAALGRAEH
jgi:hypothetical protein